MIELREGVKAAPSFAELWNGSFFGQRYRFDSSTLGRGLTAVQISGILGKHKTLEIVEPFGLRWSPDS
jgi:hypothetical protein